MLPGERAAADEGEDGMVIEAPFGASAAFGVTDELAARRARRRAS
jgi:hypothetical protein